MPTKIQIYQTFPTAGRPHRVISCTRYKSDDCPCRFNTQFVESDSVYLLSLRFLGPLDRFDGLMGEGAGGQTSKWRSEDLEYCFPTVVRAVLYQGLGFMGRGLNALDSP